MAKRMSMAERLKQSGSATVEKLDEAKKRLRKQSEGQSIEHSKEQSKEQSSGQSNGLTDSVADTLADSLADSRTVTPKDRKEGTQKDRPKSTLKGTLTPGPGDDPYFWMTPNQAAVLRFLSTIPGGKTRLADICNGTGVPYGTVRKSLAALERYNCITRPKKIRIGQWQGMHIELLESGKEWNTLKGYLFNTLPGSLQNTQKGGHSGGHSGGQASISSSSLKETTTIQKIENEISQNPELGYWRQKGLTPKQAHTWMNQFDLETGTLIESLCYCKFDMVDNDREKSEPINDVFNWFFRILERTGAYPKPTNYKSHRQKQIELEKQRVEELKHQAEQLKQLRQQAIIAQTELDFEQLLKDPESDEYKQCLEKIPDIIKKPNKRGSISFINAMKKAYCKLKDLELF